MRRRIAALAVAASLAAAGQARADWPVIDVSALARWGQQLQTAAQQLDTLKQQYTTAVTQLQSMTHLTNMAGILPQLQMPMLQNPLPIQGDVRGLLSGQGNGGALAGLLGQNLQANTVYQPQGNGWYDQQLIANGRSIAGAQSLSQQLYDSAQQRVPLMQQLVEQLNVAQDPSEREALMARIQGEQAIIQSQQAQAQSVSLWYASQTQLVQQQSAERERQDMDTYLAQAKADGIDLGQ